MRRTVAFHDLMFGALANIVLAHALRHLVMVKTVGRTAHFLDRNGYAGALIPQIEALEDPVPLVDRRKQIVGLAQVFRTAQKQKPSRHERIGQRRVKVDLPFVGSLSPNPVQLHRPVDGQRPMIITSNSMLKLQPSPCVLRDLPTFP